MFRRPTITDARRRPVSLTRHEFLFPGLSDPERRRRLVRAGHSEAALRVNNGQGVKLLAGVTLVSLLLMLVPIWLISRFHQDLRNWLGMAMAIWIPLDAWVVTAWLTRRFAADQIADAYRRAGYCPSCGHELRGVPAGSDDVTTCPECGAAWQIPRPA